MPIRPEPTPRKFTMADLMILVAGCAVGIAWTRVYYAERFGLVGEPEWEWKYQLPYLVLLPAPALAPIGVALLACRLRRPRPRLRRLFRQPGSLAIIGMPLLLLLNATTLLIGRGLEPLVDRIWPPTAFTAIITTGSYSTSLLYAASESGLVIAACWLLLLAVGRWRPEPTWIDRSGRCLGGCWIAIYLAGEMLSGIYQ